MAKAPPILPPSIKSTKSNRPVGHERFRDLYAKQPPATTPELANRAPRQVPQSITPTKTGTATPGNKCTPVIKTPKKPPNPKKNQAKREHVPSATDGTEHFENDGKAQLAVARIKTRELKWKSLERTQEASADESDAGGSESDQASASYKTAVKLMKILKRNNYLENALSHEDREKVRKHFESASFGQAPPPQILALLNRALDFALETVLFRKDELGTSMTNELRVFIIKKQEARESMREVILNRPWLLPNSWGGARVSAKRSKTRGNSCEGGDKRGGWLSSLFR